MTAAALGIDLSELELPVPLDRHAYQKALKEMTARGLIENGSLTQYGRDVEAMPVDRPWAELLVHANDNLTQYVAVMANIESLHRLTREDHNIRGLVTPGSDHLTGYNVYAEAVNQTGFVGSVYGLERHQFDDSIDEWSEYRGVLVKGIEDIALGMASVMRTVESPLPKRLPAVSKQILKEFRLKAAQETTRKYCEEHKYHCFRCGAKSLAEIERGDVKIDICVNESCGAVHLDPGELEKIIKDQKSISSIRNTFLSVFKKK